jgi:hypothetical protein
MCVCVCVCVCKKKISSNFNLQIGQIFSSFTQEQNCFSAYFVTEKYIFGDTAYNFISGIVETHCCCVKNYNFLTHTHTLQLLDKLICILMQ